MKRGIGVAAAACALTMGAAHCADFSAADDPAPTPEAGTDAKPDDAVAPTDAPPEGGSDLDGTTRDAADGPILMSEPGCKARQTSGNPAKYCADFDDPTDAYALWVGTNTVFAGLKKMGTDEHFMRLPITGPTLPFGMKVTTLGNGATTGWLYFDVPNVKLPFGFRFSAMSAGAAADSDVVKLDFGSGNSVVLRSRLNSLDVVVSLANAVSKTCTLGKVYELTNKLHAVRLAFSAWDAVTLTVDNSTPASCDQTGVFGADGATMSARFGANRVSNGETSATFDKIVME